MRALAVLLLSLPASAWNGTGHRVIAAIAYDHLTPTAKARVDALLDQHPDRNALLAGDARQAFLAAATWPDLIRNDPRFYDDTRANAQPTPPLAGFPTMARHTNWHYMDIPFSPDGTPLEQAKPPNALTELRRMLANVKQDTPYDLPWLLHLEGDVHNPLHCTSRFLKSQPHGDAGGNSVIVAPGRTLHLFWDDLAGTDITDAYVNMVEADIVAEFTRANGTHPHLGTDPKKWFDEGFALARHDVYTFGPETGSREHPLMLPEGYEANARRIARMRIAIAGFRMAQILNKALK